MIAKRGWTREKERKRRCRRINREDKWEDNAYLFYKMPKALFEDPAYKKLSDGGKLLYCVLLNRMGLSQKNEWRDENGKVYIYYTNRKLRELFGWGHDKVTGRYKELERAGLIRRRKDKIGGPDSIYVLPLPKVSGFSAPGGSALQQPPLREISADPCDDFAASKTEYKKTEIRENDLSADGYDATFFSNRIKGNIDYDILSEYKVDKAKLDELIRLMTDVCCGTAPMVRIGGSEYRRQDVAERFLSLDDAHIEYVMDKLESGTANVKNMRAYALTVLYNAPATMELDLERQLRHDFACNA